MSGRAVGAVMASSTLNRRDGSFRLLLALAEYAGNDGIAWPGRDELLKRIGCKSDRHLRRCIKTASAAGELERREANDGREVWRVVVGELDPPNLERLAKHHLALAEPFSAADTQVRKPRTSTSAKADTRGRSTRARSLPGLTVSEPSASGGSAPDGETAQELVAFYVSENRRLGAETIPKLASHIGRESKALLRDGVSPDEIRAGLAVVAAKGLNPSALASCVQEHRLRQPSRRETDGRFTAYDD